MIKYLLIVLGLLFFESGRAEKNQTSVDNQKIDFDWQFHLGDVQNGQDPDLNSSSWRILDLPHDWNVEGSTVSNSGPTDNRDSCLPG